MWRLCNGPSFPLRDLQTVCKKFSKSQIKRFHSRNCNSHTPWRFRGVWQIIHLCVAAICLSRQER